MPIREEGQAAMPEVESKTHPHWDPYDVWLRLLRNHPIRVEDPAATTGRMTRRDAKAFWASIAELPDPLQDAVFVIAHARGFEAALAALDQAIREHMAACRRRNPVVLRAVPSDPAPREGAGPVRRAAS